MTSTTDSMKLQRMKTLMNFHNHTSQEPSSSLKYPKRCTRSTSSSLSFFALHKRKCTIDVEPGAKKTKGDTEIVCTPTQVPAFLKYACISPSQTPSKKDLSLPLFSSSFPVNMPSPPASSQQSHTRKLKSLVISSDLNALLNHEENSERYTNRPPSPLSDEANITPESSQVAAGTTSRPVHPSFSRSPPISPSLPTCSPTSRPSTSSSPSSSASSNFHTGPFGSLIHGGNHTRGHTPDTSLTSLASIVEGADGEPLLKSLPPPPRPGNKIVPTKVARARPGVIPGPSASLTSRPVVNPDKDSSAAVHWQISRVLAGEDAVATTKTKILDKTSEQHGRPLSASKDSDFKSSKSASPSISSIQTAQIIPPSYNNSHSLLPLTSYAPLIQNRTSCTSNSSHSVISSSSSDSTSTVTPGRLEMEVKSTRPNVRLLPSLPPVAPFSNRAHSIRHSKSAHNFNHHSAPPGTVYASAGDISKRKASRRVKVLSAEDVLGELFRKEDALDSLRILARTGTGITFQEEVPLPVSPSSSRHSRTSAKSRSTQGLEERVGTSFLRMAFEEDDEEGGSDREDATQIHSSDLPTAGTSIPTTPRLRPSHSSEVSVMHLNEGHVFEKLHPYSGHYSGSGPARPSASSAKSVSSRSSSSASVLSYAYAPTGDERYSKVLKMGSKSGSTEGYGGNAAAANVVVQGVNNDGVSRRSQYRRQRPARIFISPTEDKNGTHSQHPTTSNSKALPQLPRLIPPSPLSASFERSLGLSEHTVSEVSSATLAVPASPITSSVTNQVLPSAENFSFGQQRSSFVSIQSGSEESTFSRRPGSISTLAFGNLKSGSGNETYEISLDSDKDSSSNYLRGYEGDYDSASAESSSEGEVDFAKYYERRVSEDLQHVQQTYRASRHRHNFNKKPKETGTLNQLPRQYRRRTVPMDRRGTSYYYSSGEEHVRYLEEVEIIDLRAETQRQQGMPRRLRSNSHANDEILEPGSTEAFVVDNQHPSKRRYTTLTTNTTPSSPDGISTTLSAFHFVDEDPWSSTEYEREAEPEDHRISISSAVYSQSYYDPYDVLPTPRTVPSLPYPQSGHPEVIDTMRRNARSNYSELEDRVSFMELISPTTESKPPLPTTPKPDFSTLHSAGRSSRSLERRLPNQEHGRRPHKFSNSNSRSNSRTNSYDNDVNMQLPPTSNNLDPLSRADLVRKSRKLAQVFGQTPNGASLLPTTSGMADTYPMRRSFLDITSPTSSRHHISNSVATFRKNSVGDTKQKVKENMDRVKGKGIWPPPASTHYISATSGRRHSTPLTPDDFDFLNELHLQEPISSRQTDREASSIFGNGEDGNLIEIGDAQQVEGDSASFIDWDDELPGPNGTKNKHPAELQTQSPPGSQNSSRRSSVSSLAFASPSAYPGGAPRNSFTREDYIGTELPAAPFDDTDDEGGQKRDLQQHLARQPSLISLVTPSLMSPEERAEAEKRRKREKLAKLHRFLGSRVPTGLVLGLGQAEEDSESGLPGLSVSSMGEETDAEGSSEEKRSWKKGMVRVTRRRSGSESGVSSDWSDIRDRRKDDMGEDERLRMVKRAIRLEKVFGVAPPQTLYAYGSGHVPHYHSLSSPGVITPSVGPTMIRSSSTGTTEAILTLNPLPPKRGHTRPASREFLLPKGDSTDQHAIEVEVGDVSGTLRVSRPRGASLAYTHYEHSLNSLGDILDRDDRASLQELHEILYRAGDAEQLSAGFRPEPNQDFAGIDGNPPSNGSGSARSERRLSLPALPARTSIASLNSLDSVGSILSKVSFDDADVEASDGTFQVRRRRAAKLTQFFGVDYRDLVQDVLDSIENGVEMEKGRGLSRQEAEDLLRKLRTIKGKRTGVFS